MKLSDYNLRLPIGPITTPDYMKDLVTAMAPRTKGASTPMNVEQPKKPKALIVERDANYTDCARCGLRLAEFDWGSERLIHKHEALIVPAYDGSPHGIHVCRECCTKIQGEDSP